MVVKKRVIDQLMNSTLFANVGRKELIQLLGNEEVELCQYAKNEVVFTPKKFKRALAFLSKGHLKVMVGDGQLVMSKLKSGTFFAVATLFNGEEEYISSIVANSNAEVVFFPQSVVEKCIESYPEFALNYIRLLHSKVRFLNKEIEVLGASSGKNSMISFLLNSSQAIGEPFRLEVSYSQLADQLNMSRSSLYRALDELVADGIIARDGRNITVLKRG
ncbi:MAG: Crp/Fnr family transcriptional regulator [Erysipelotrichaceae bacterium]|nr:Crp/Fnr family transcriptional regulator [Erysipelotrichaceae bacterium]